MRGSLKRVPTILWRTVPEWMLPEHFRPLRVPQAFRLLVTFADRIHLVAKDLLDRTAQAQTMVQIPKEPIHFAAVVFADRVLAAVDFDIPECLRIGDQRFPMGPPITDIIPPATQPRAIIRSYAWTT